MTNNWGPYCIVPSSLRKSSGGTELRESLDYDLLRQELIADGLPLEVARVRNPWYYRKKESEAWLMIGESEDIEDNFPVKWDISRLDGGSYQVMGLMHVFLEEGASEKAVLVRQHVANVTILN